MKFKKTLSLALIYLIITISFALYTPVEAQQQGCCQQTNAGEYCLFTDKDSCSTNFAPGTSCNFASFCEPGCCLDNKEGSCHTAVGKAKCESQPDATWIKDPTCETSQCNLGCCKIGNQCSLATELQCKSTASAFPGVQMQFDPGIAAETDCIEKCRGEEQGACVSGRSCTFTTRALCSGDFHINTLCSNPTLNTDCAKQQTTNCHNGDVYWFDSCGNTENIYSSNKQWSYNNGFVLPESGYSIADPNDKKNGNCDYLQGTICGEAKTTKPTYGDYICKDLNCYDVYENDASPNSGGNKKHGESWCIYEDSDVTIEGGNVGPGKDVVGSRHYLTTCLNGEEVIVPCRDKREEICVQNKVGEEAVETEVDILETLFDLADYTQAACIPNRADDCLLCNDLDDCTDPQCSKLSGLRKKLCCRSVCCENFEKTCYWMQTSALPVHAGDIAESGFCVPLISPGTNFWETDSTSCADVSSYLKCTSVVERPPLTRHWKWEDYDCKKHCQCEISHHTNHYVNPEWVQAANIICRAQGDCGAYFNVEGEATFGGYSFTGRSGNYELSTADLKKWPSSLIPINPGFDEVMSDGWAIVTLAAIIGFEWATLWAITQTGWWLAATAAQQFWAITGPILGGIFLIYLTIDTVWGDREKDNKFTFTCLPWEPPDKGNCEKCTDGEEHGFECTEYKCKSLGKNCRYIEEDERITCIATTSYDITPPQISPMPLADYTITTTLTGFSINENIPAFSPLKLGVQTDEPATCKYATEANIAYDEMPALFGLSNTYKHEIEFSFPSEFTTEEALALTNGGKYTIYIKCKDYSQNENINKADYAVAFEIDTGPDLNPPTIEQFSILPDSMISYDTTELDFSIYLNEPANCKWSKLDKSYEEMENTFTCATSGFDTSSIYYNLYDCSTKLTNIQQTTLNTFYFRCKDQANNEMQQSFTYKLLSTIPLQIASTSPTAEVFTKNPVLKVRTESGAENGIATCAYSDQEVMIENMIQMFNTNALESSQQLRQINPGTYTFHFKCIDKAGNLASSSTSFEIIAAEEASFIYNIYKDKISNTLHISTVEDADCQYSQTSFTYGLGTPMVSAGKSHTAPLGYPIYYMICQDKFNNQASIIVTP